MLELFRTRRSIRKFTPESISKEHLDRILKAGLIAPSSKNSMPLEFVVVENLETIKAITKCKHPGSQPLLSSTLAIAILADTNKSNVWPEDASIAALQMQLEIEKLGLGSCWIQIRLRFDENNIDSDIALRKLLGYPENVQAMCVLAIGHKDEEKAAYTEKDYNFDKIHYEKY